jgi:hypothetical protein
MEDYIDDVQLAAGLKLHVGEHLCTEEDMEEFLEEATCTIDPPFESISPDNALIAKYYDYYTGDIYFHFSHPVDAAILEPYFDYENIIPFIFEN